ncbi:putative drug/proton antiporter YHK8 [Cyphellophora attinorum]|uniref:Putative drug/proton antiporter YHK8 n=1 Tax=Cyphellophora attinorum TaxID=1664694 RepID=A0A0N1P0A4_9EURO|nr:putative drug/proton antiporter YHK8 [Phialophora attinorum]KPI39954.1 putative drug/proton antiporter YHK8 [Phialophora attinorum]
MAVLEALKKSRSRGDESQTGGISPSTSLGSTQHGDNDNSSDLEKGEPSPDTSPQNNKDEGSEHFLVAFDGDDDPLSAKNKKTATKWAIVIILAVGSFCVTCASSLYTTTYAGMSRDFGSSRLTNTLGLSTFVYGLGIAPMVLGPLSEFYGRRIIYLLAFGGFFVFLIPCAVAQNIATMLVVRFFDGFFGSAFLSVAGGTVGDMFTRAELQTPMLIYSASPFLGPATAPVWGGFVNSFIDWRWSWYIMLIFAGAEFIMIAVFKRKETGDERWKAPIEVSDKSVLWTVVHSLYRPFLMLFLDPMVLNICLFSAVLLGILYLFFGAIPLVFGHVYGFNLWQNGLAFLGIFVGMVSAMATDPIWRRNYGRLMDKKERETGERKSEPEMRLPQSIFGGWFSVFGLFLFAWTCYPSVHWIVPIIGTAFFGFGIILIYTSFFTFLVEAYPLYAASALSANSFARSCFAASFPIFGLQMYEKLDYHWATTLLAFLCLALAPFPYVFWIYGKQLRKKSKFGSA